MQIGSKEHYDIMAAFEKVYKGMRLDHEKDKNLWKKSQVYESGETNTLYQAFIAGYSFGRIIYL